MLALQNAEYRCLFLLYLHGLKTRAKHLRLVGNICSMHIHIYMQHITITNIKISLHSYNGLNTSTYAFIQNLFLFRTYAHNRLMFIRISRRSYRTYSYSEIPVGFTYQNDTHLFTLIHHSGYYHIIKGIPRTVLVNEISTRRYCTVLKCRSTKQECRSTNQNRSAVALAGVPKH